MSSETQGHAAAGDGAHRVLWLDARCPMEPQQTPLQAQPLAVIVGMFEDRAEPLWRGDRTVGVW